MRRKSFYIITLLVVLLIALFYSYGLSVERTENAPSAAAAARDAALP
jgi:hypothetical protein